MTKRLVKFLENIALEIVYYVLYLLEDENYFVIFNVFQQERELISECLIIEFLLDDI